MNNHAIWVLLKDIELFRYLHALKVAKISQIQRDLRYDSVKTLYSRVSQLDAAGYLETYMHRRLGKQKLVSLAPKGFKEYFSTEDALRCELKSKSVMHDVTLVDIKNRFSQSEKIDVYHTENTLQTWLKFKRESETKPFVEHRCDAMVGVKVSTGLLFLAVEYEASEKAHHRYDNLFFKYYNDEEIPAVIYICESNERMKVLKEIERRGFGNIKPKVFYTTLERFMTSSELSFYAHNGDKIELGRISKSSEMLQNIPKVQNFKCSITV